MNSFLFLLAEASVSMALFYMVYWLFLRKETCFTANRFYLTGALLLSVFLPLFPLRYTVWVAPGEPSAFEALTDAFHQIVPAGNELVQSTQVISPANFWSLLYWTGAFFVLGRLIFQSMVLVRLIVATRADRENGTGIVENSRYPMPFSFFRYIFINPAIHSGSDLNDIIAHEKVHIREYHWIDLLIAEMLTVVFWFNPFVWWFERSIKQNHEYLADAGVLAQGQSVGRYQALLINQLLGVQVFGVTNHLNFALNATRLNMMKQNKKSKFRAARMAWALPIAAALIMAFSDPVYQQLPVENADITLHLADDLQDYLTVSGVIKRSDGTPLPGTSVVVGGTSTGTIADMDGRFQLKIPAGMDATVHFSFVGYETSVVRLADYKGEGSITVEMKEGIFRIDPARHFAAPPPPPPPPPPPSSTVRSSGETFQEVFIVVEQLPVYPGSFYALGQYVHFKVQELKEKALADGRNLTGNSLVGFTVGADGKVAGIQVLESDNQAAANAALEVARGMSVWEPGKQRGKAVPVNFSLPVSF